MATYTENYNLKKPTYAEPANVKDINDNMEIIDDVMHSTQISLADAYDQNETYNTGDIVMYEMLMYKCKEDNVTGAWNASKWKRTTAGESGGGADLDIYGEASGTAEASFSDGAEARLVECEIGIVPTQDLHGYSKPWAGGAGKNKLNASTATTNTLNGVTFTVVKNDANEVIRIDVTGTANAGTTFNIGTATIEAGTYIFSGYTDGSNVGTKYINYRGIVNAYGSDVTATISETKTTSVTLQIANGAETEFSIYPMIRESTALSGFEPYSNICPISGHTDVTVTVASTSGGSGDDTTVSLGRTVYGGTLDVTTGELTIDKVIADLGTQTYTYDAQYSRFYTYVIADMKVVSNRTMPLVCSCYETIDDGRAVSEVPNGSIYAVSEKRLYIHDNSTTSPSDLATALSGQTCVYELATPQTFTLTPTQVLTLLGQNYVSHDGGGNIKVVYIRDLDIVINDLIDRVTALENE